MRIEKHLLQNYESLFHTYQIHSLAASETAHPAALMQVTGVSAHFPYQ